MEMSWSNSLPVLTGLFQQQQANHTEPKQKKISNLVNVNTCTIYWNFSFRADSFDESGNKIEEIVKTWKSYYSQDTTESITSEIELNYVSENERAKFTEFQEHTAFGKQGIKVAYKNTYSLNYTMSAKYNCLKVKVRPLHLVFKEKIFSNPTRPLERLELTVEKGVDIDCSPSNESYHVMLDDPYKETFYPSEKE